jgi:hypothetical protein
MNTGINLIVAGSALVSGAYRPLGNYWHRAYRKSLRGNRSLDRDHFDAYCRAA